MRSRPISRPSSTPCLETPPEPADLVLPPPATAPADPPADPALAVAVVAWAVAVVAWAVVAHWAAVAPSATPAPPSTAIQPEPAIVWVETPAAPTAARIAPRPN